MTALPLRSSLAKPITRFVEHKRALNCKYRAEASALRLFDRYLEEHAIDGWTSVDSAVIEGFLQSRNHRLPRSHNHLLGVLRRFFDWAVVQRFVERNPVLARPRAETSRRVPYLLGLQDMRHLLEIVRSLPDRSTAPHRAQVYEMIFALLYGLGLRVGEASRLRLGDLDPARATLLIRATKFGKSRFVPFGPNLANRLERYLDTVHKGASDPERPLFAFVPGRCVRPESVSRTFHSLLPRLDLPIAPGVAPPRVHDLRHSFACSTLLRWYKQGVDPNRRLMRLSTFLGHVDPASTAVYLTITEDLLREADRRFRAFAREGGSS